MIWLICVENWLQKVSPPAPPHMRIRYLFLFRWLQSSWKPRITMELRHILKIKVHNVDIFKRVHVNGAWKRVPFMRRKLLPVNRNAFSLLLSSLYCLFIVSLSHCYLQTLDLRSVEVYSKPFTWNFDFTWNCQQPMASRPINRPRHGTPFCYLR